MPRLVINMIGRNEVGRFLRPVLEHVKPLADFIVFTDDASTDGTPHVAAEYCDSVVKLSEPLFTTDEGALRQLSWQHLDHHAQDGDWILALDCDEMLYGTQRLPEFLDQSRYDVLGITFYHMWNETQYRVDKLWAPTISSRLFRYKPGGEFRQRRLACGAEPTYVEQAMRRGRFQPHTPFRMKHLGYIRDEDKIAKHERYMKLDGGAFHNRSHLESIVDQTPTLADWTD